MPDSTVFSTLVLADMPRPQHAVEVGVGGPEACNLGAIVNTAARVQLFEPNPRALQLLRPWLANKPHVALHEVAISDSNGPVLFRTYGHASHIEGTNAPCQREAIRKGRERITVNAHTFDRFDDGSIDVLSVDNEGSEWHVLQAMISRPRWLSIELHAMAHVKRATYTNPHEDAIRGWLAANSYRFICKDGTKRDEIYCR